MKLSRSLILFCFIFGTVSLTSLYADVRTSIQYGFQVSSLPASIVDNTAIVPEALNTNQGSGRWSIAWSGEGTGYLYVSWGLTLAPILSQSLSGSYQPQRITLISTTVAYEFEWTFSKEFTVLLGPGLALMGASGEASHTGASSGSNLGISSSNPCIAFVGELDWFPFHGESKYIDSLYGVVSTQLIAAPFSGSLTSGQGDLCLGIGLNFN